MKSGSSLKLGLLGAGGLNAIVGEAVRSGTIPGVEVVAVAGSSAGSRSAAELAESLGARVTAPEDLVHQGCSWVVEAAGGAAVRAILPSLWAAGIHTIVMSVGALIDCEVERAYHAARSAGVRVLLPSGAIAGLDGVRALAAAGGLRRARLTTTKAPAGLQGAPHLAATNMMLPSDRTVTVFEGSARQAVEGFPANVNVAIALSFAGLGPDRTEVVLRSDPAAERTRHVIVAEGEAATIEVIVASRPSPTNPRSSYLAGASAVAALRELATGSGGLSW